MPAKTYQPKSALFQCTSMLMIQSHASTELKKANSTMKPTLRR
jgi:hypothetical protein